MAGFDQNVNIDIELNAKTKNALTKISGALGTIRAQASTVGDDLDTIENEVESFGESFDKADDINIGGKVNSKSIKMAALSALHQADTAIESNRDPKVSIRADVDINSDEINNEVKNERDLFKDLKEDVDASTEAKERFSEANANVKERTKASVTELKEEERAFDDIIDSGDSLTEVKQKVAGANQHVQKMSRESAREITNEDDSMMHLLDSLGAVERSMDDTSSRSRAVNRALGKMRSSTDETTDSMRAAAQVGDLFEDGLGSLSVNLGAFTVALRNFLTQVPLLLTALGALGAAALGAAAAFVTLGAAMVALPAAGLIVEAQNIKEEFSEVENLSESLQVIMLNLKDTFMEAAAPILENAKALDFFGDAVQSVAFGINLAANLFDDLTQENAALAERVAATGEEFNTLGELMDMMDGESLENLADALSVSFALLGDEVIWAMGAMTDGLADGIVRASNLLAHSEDLTGSLSQFSSTISELAELGFRVGGGLLPVFRSFSEIVESVASALNDMDGATMENIVTFTLLIAAINKVSGVLSSFVTIIPNMIVGMGNIATRARGVSGAFNTMRAATLGASAQLGGFLKQSSLLGGMTSLVTALTGITERTRSVAFHTSAAASTFDKLAEEVDYTTEELRELAIQGKLAEEAVDDLSETDVDIGTNDGKVDPQQFLPDGPIANRLFGGVGDAAEDAKNDVGKVFGSGGAIIPGMQGIQSRSDSPFKMFEDDDAALQVVKNKFADMKSTASSAIPTLDGIKSSFGSMKKSAKSAGATIVQSMVGALGTLVTSLAFVIQRTWAFITASWAEKKAMLSSAATKIAGAAANYALAAAEYVATSGALALAAALAVATGGITILIAAVGALAVGVITNFQEIKSAASESFGFIKEVVDILVDVLLTVFVETWNIIANAVQAFMAGISPLTDMVTDLAESIGLMGGKGEEGAGFMSMLATAGEVAKTAMGALGDIFIAMFDIIGGVLTVVTTLIRIGLTPLIFTINLLVDYIGLVIDFWDFFLKKILGVEGGVSGLSKMFKSMFDTFLQGVQSIPSAVEDIVNSVIDILNGFFESIPQIGELENVDFTSDVGTSREELASDTKNMTEGTESKGDKTINYEEDNSTNVNQTVNADPEDKAQLSRITKDAIEEANAFSRRRQGGQ